MLTMMLERKSFTSLSLKICHQYNQTKLYCNQEHTLQTILVWTSGQDTGIHRHAFPPHATTERITTKPQNSNTQNCQKIKRHRSPKIKDLKTPHSSRQVGGAEMQRCVERCRVKKVASYLDLILLQKAIFSILFI